MPRLKQRIEAPPVVSDEVRLLALKELRRRNWRSEYERFYWLKDKSGKVRPVGPGGLNLVQEMLFAAIRWWEERNKPIRIIVGKSRKKGVSTAVAMYFSRRVYEDEVDGIVISHDKVSAKKIFDIYRRFYARYGERDYGLPKPKISIAGGRVGLREMRFDHHDGHLQVETANNIYAGTSETPQLIHRSEVSKWSQGEETVISLNQSIGDEPGTADIWESTFNGEEATFLPMWRAAYDNARVTWSRDEHGLLVCHMEVTRPKDWNGYLPIFSGAFDDETARIPFETEAEKTAFLQTLTEYERVAMERHHVNAEFLNWRRHTLKSKCKNSEDVMRQEYPIHEAEAIRVSGSPRFNVDLLDMQPIEEGRVGRLVRSHGWDGHVIFERDPAETITIYRTPRPGHRYIIGADIAEGVEEEVKNTRDATVAHVYDIDEGWEQMAVYHSTDAKPEESIVPIYYLHLYYNEAFCVPESNGQGMVVCLGLQEAGVPAHLLYHRDDWDEAKTHRKRAVGHKTHIGNRHVLIKLISDAINDNEVAFHDRRTVQEHKSFVNRAGRYEAAKGCHDDHVFAHGLARMGARVADMVHRSSSREAVMARAAAVRRWEQSVDPVTGC